MPSGLSPADRRLLLGAGIFGLAMIAATVAFAPAPEDSGGRPVPSSYVSSAGGALAAYTLLQEMHVPVRRLEDSPTTLPADPPGTVLVIAEPFLAPSKGERHRLLEYVQQGGRILFCGAMLPQFFPGPSLRGDSEGVLNVEWKNFAPIFPNALSRQAEDVVMRPESHWTELTAAQLALYGTSDKPAVVSWRMGKGELLWWAAASPLTNAGITRGDNLRFFLNSLGLHSAREVIWDEYYHGQRGSLWDYVAATPIYWGIMQAAFIALAVLWTFSRRSGPLSMPAPVSRLSPLEFVDTMGGLYQRAGAGALAVDVSYKQLRLKLARRLGMATSTPDAELAAAAGERLGAHAPDLLRALQSASAAAAQPKLRGPAALKIVDSLEFSLAQLDHPHSQQEKQ